MKNKLINELKPKKKTLKDVLLFKKAFDKENGFSIIIGKLSRDFVNDYGDNIYEVFFDDEIDQYITIINFNKKWEA